MEIRQATLDDLKGIAKVHAKCFPNYLSTRIGAGNDCYLLSQFYKEYVSDSPELFLVLEDDNKNIAGFCMGYYMDRTGQQDRYIKNNKRRVLTRLLWLLLKGDKLAWAKLKLKVNKPQYVFLSDKLKGVPNSEIGDMLSMCILPEMRGRRYSSLMAKQYLENMKNAGRKYCLLSMHVTNSRAIAFFTKNGFEPWRKIGETSITYVKQL